MNTTLAEVVNEKLKKFNLKKKDFKFNITEIRKYGNTTYTWCVVSVNNVIYTISEPYIGARTTDVKNSLIYDVLTTMENEEEEKDMQNFIDYVLDFYGEKGVYPIKNINKDVIVKAIKKRIDLYPSLPFIFDSMDRELVRDVILKYM